MQLEPGDEAPDFTRPDQDGTLVSLSDFRGRKVIGISADDAESHRRFRQKYGLTFPLLTDADHRVMKQYGAFGEKNMYGRITMGVIRATFVIDADGRVQRAWYRVRSDGHARKVLEALGS